MCILLIVLSKYNLNEYILNRLAIGHSTIKIQSASLMPGGKDLIKDGK